MEEASFRAGVNREMLGKKGRRNQFETEGHNYWRECSPHFSPVPLHFRGTAHARVGIKICRYRLPLESEGARAPSGYMAPAPMLVSETSDNVDQQFRDAISETNNIGIRSTNLTR